MIASSSPAVLVGQIAAATRRIRVGTAAVQLGHTTAVAVAESFGTLAAFHPGRIDLGVGRSGHKRTEAARAAPAQPRTPRQWHETDGVVIPAPFDIVALLRNPRLQAQAGPFPTSGDPLIIGEHEVAPVRCCHCDQALPWPLVKGWRT